MKQEEMYAMMELYRKICSYTTEQEVPCNRSENLEPLPILEISESQTFEVLLQVQCTYFVH